MINKDDIDAFDPGITEPAALPYEEQKKKVQQAVLEAFWEGATLKDIIKMLQLVTLYQISNDDLDKIVRSAWARMEADRNS